MASKTGSRSSSTESEPDNSTHQGTVNPSILILKDDTKTKETEGSNVGDIPLAVLTPPSQSSVEVKCDGDIVTGDDVGSAIGDVIGTDDDTTSAGNNIGSVTGIDSGRGDAAVGEEAETDAGGCCKRTRGKWRNRTYRRRIVQTLWLGASFWALGFAVGQRGPAFLDLQIITQIDVEQASFFFTASSVGYLVGSLMAGVVYDKLSNKSLSLLATLVGMGSATLALPWCSPYVLMLIVHFVLAFFAGGLDTVVNAELVREWGKEGETAMQFLHFSFAFGGVVSPLVTKPFLTPIPSHHEHLDNASTTQSSLSQYDGAVDDMTSDNTENITGASVLFDYSATVAPLMNHSVTVAANLPQTTRVHYAYVISGVLALLASVPWTMEAIRNRRHKELSDTESKAKEQTQPLPTGLFLFVSFVLCLFYFIYCCVDDTFASLLATFVVKQLGWSKAEGAEISSLFWASFAAGRFVSIFVVRCLSSAQLIVLCCVSLILSMLGFLLVARYEVYVGVWVLTALGSMSMGPIFATGFTWMEEELVRVTGRVVSAILVASSAGNMVNPVITAWLLQAFTPMWFCYLLLAESSLCLLVFFVLLAISRCYVSKHYTVN